MTALPAILLITSPLPIGLKPGFLCDRINLLGVKALTDCSSSEQSFSMKFAKALRRSLDELPNSILRHPSASKPDDPKPPFINIAACITKDSLMLSYATERIGLNGPCGRASGEDSIDAVCFCFSKSYVLLDNRRIPFDMLSLELFDIFGMFVVLLRAFKRSCIV